MFKIGEWVVYPHHGVGKIESIQTKEAFSEKKRYYILNLATESLTISIPVDNSSSLGLRNIIDKNKASKVLKVFKEKYKKQSDIKERFQQNSEKIGSGDPFALAEVIRDLRNYPELPTREKKMLEKATNLLVSELKHSFNKSEEEMIKQVNIA